jgi:hypothetical protein
MPVGFLMIEGTATPARLCFVRAPYQYRYARLSVQEEQIISYFLGYLRSIGFESYDVVDFHLARDSNADQLLARQYSHYIIAVRESGENVHYIRRLCRYLAANSGTPIILYGQIARLRHFTDWPESVRFVRHDEVELAAVLGLSAQGSAFTEGLTITPYYPQIKLESWQLRRLRGAIETTRGCHFGCKFCFINQGKNYPQRWQVRPNEAVLTDIETFVALGVRNFEFYDSEFVGDDESSYDQKRALLLEIRARFLGIRFKIYCRADTLLRFDEFDLLKEAGLVQVFIGVESFHQPDLDALNKKLDAKQAIECIERLQEKGIYANPSFIVFNRNTTTASIRVNLDAVDELMARNSRLLGVPSFTFSFESNWRPSKSERAEDALSGKTYVHVDLKQKEQPSGAQIFNVHLEPLMEIYRLLSYEWSKKVTNLNIARDGVADAAARSAIAAWFEGLPGFCSRTMRDFLDRFERGDLTLETLPDQAEDLFTEIANYYSRRLPNSLASLETYQSHAAKIAYDTGVKRVEEDEYWLESIPA